MKILYFVALIYIVNSTSTTGNPEEPETTTTGSLAAMIDTPSFLNAATDSQKKEYFELDSNPNLTLDMKSKALLNWASRCGEPVNTLYNQYISQTVAIQQSESQRMSLIVSQLSPEAQQADKNVREITGNMNQTKKEMDAKVTKQLNALPKKVYYELTFATQ